MSFSKEKTFLAGSVPKGVGKESKNIHKKSFWTRLLLPSCFTSFSKFLVAEKILKFWTVPRSLWWPPTHFYNVILILSLSISVSVSINLRKSVCPSVCPSIRLPFHPSICMYVYIYVSMWLSIIYINHRLLVQIK